MKKFIVVPVILITLTIIGCGSTGGGNAAAAAASDPYTVDLSSVKYAVFSFRGNSLTSARSRTNVLGTSVRNAEPLELQYDGVVYILPESADVTKYQRVTVKAKFYNTAGDEINMLGGGAMIVIAYDPEGDLEGPEMGTGPNTPLKEFNYGGQSTVHTDRGSRVRLSQNPGAILIQITNTSIKFIELVEVSFHD